MIRFNAIDPIDNSNISRDHGHVERNRGLIKFSTMVPSTNKIESGGEIEEHAAPKWMRLLSGDKQKMRGENTTKGAKKEARNADGNLRDTWDSGDLRGGFDSLVDRSSVVQRLFTMV